MWFYKTFFTSSGSPYTPNIPSVFSLAEVYNIFLRINTGIYDIFSELTYSVTTTYILGASIVTLVYPVNSMSLLLFNFL